jgi:hypothetical protein
MSKWFPRLTKASERELLGRYIGSGFIVYAASETLLAYHPFYVDRNNVIRGMTGNLIEMDISSDEKGYEVSAQIVEKEPEGVTTLRQQLAQRDVRIAEIEAAMKNVSAEMKVVAPLRESRVSTPAMEMWIQRLDKALQGTTAPAPKSEALKPKFQKDQVVKVLVGDEEGQTGYVKSVDASLDGSFSYEIVLRTFAQTQEYEEFELEAYTEPQSFIDYGNKFDDWQAIVAEHPYAKPEESEQATLTTEEIDWLARAEKVTEEGITYYVTPIGVFSPWNSRNILRSERKSKPNNYWFLVPSNETQADIAAIAKRRNELKGE